MIRSAWQRFQEPREGETPELGYRVDKSRIPEAGYGLFATRLYRSGDEIGVYSGDRITFAEVNQAGRDSTYLMSFPRYVWKGVEEGGYVIDASGLDHDMRWVCYEAFKPNARITQCRPRGEMLIKAVRKIRPGEEITMDYGYDLYEELEVRERKRIFNEIMSSHAVTFCGDSSCVLCHGRMPSK